MAKETVDKIVLDTTNHYTTLWIKVNADNKEIKKAYRTLAMKLHPDKNQGESDNFNKISEAYKTLSNQEERRKYNINIWVQNNEVTTEWQEEVASTFSWNNRYPWAEDSEYRKNYPKKREWESTLDYRDRENEYKKNNKNQ